MSKFKTQSGHQGAVRARFDCILSCKHGVGLGGKEDVVFFCHGVAFIWSPNEINLQQINETVAHHKKCKMTCSIMSFFFGHTVPSSLFFSVLDSLFRERLSVCCQPSVQWKGIVCFFEWITEQIKQEEEGYKAVWITRVELSVVAVWLISFPQIRFNSSSY